MNDSEKLAVARKLIVDSLIALGVRGLHSEECAGHKFAQSHKYLPANHPAWKSAPQCNCLMSRLANFLKD